MFVLPDQPQSIGKVLDSGIKLYLASFKYIILLSLISNLASAAPSIFMPALMPTFKAGNWNGFALIFVLIMLAIFWMTCAMIYRMGLLSRGQQVSLGATLSLGLRRLAPVLLGGILSGLAIMVGMVALVIPGLFLMMSLSFVSAEILLDDAGLVESLRRSHRLVRGNWWRTLTVYSVPGVIFMVLYIGLAAVLGATLGVTGNAAALSTHQWMMQLPLSLFGALISPLFYAVYVVQYHDLKLRKHGADLETRLEGAFQQA